MGPDFHVDNERLMIGTAAFTLFDADAFDLPREERLINSNWW